MNSSSNGLYCARWMSTPIFVGAFDEAIVARVASLLTLPFERCSQCAPTPQPDLIATGDNRLVWTQGGETFRCANREDLIICLVAMIGSHLLYYSKNNVLHCGGFVSGGRACLYCGPALVGKSTLSFEAWKLQYPLINDDWVVINPESCTASAFPKPLKLRVDSASLPEEIQRLIPSQHRLVGQLMSGERRLILGRALPGMLPLSEEVPVQALFLLERGSQPKSEVLPAEREDALLTILTQSMETGKSPLKVLKLLESLRATGSVYRLVVGENDSAGAVGLMATQI